MSDFKEAQKIVGFCSGERPKGDFYASPPIAVEKLLDYESFGNLVLEPCCGNGAISRVLISKGYNVISRDLYDWGYGEPNKNFLTEHVIDVDAIITNPPFNASTEFALKGLECTKIKEGKVAILNRLQWLEGIKRRKIFKENKLSKVLVFSKRIPRFHRFDFTGKPGTSLICFAWFIFDWKHEKEITIDFIV